MRLLPLFAALLVAGCASSSGGRPPLARPAETGGQSALRPPPSGHRVDNVIGRNAAALTALFGQPALDVQEGSARKLQFLAEQCVLDAYLYAPRERAEPVVTHVDARTREGGDADRAACIAALRRR